MTREQLIIKVRECISAIITEGYYLETWGRVSHHHNRPLEELSLDELLRPFQEFWELLPDSPSIRRHPFYQVCDLAEQYCFTDD